MKYGLKVIIKKGKPREDEMGTYVGDEKTPIGLLNKITFPDGKSGLYRYPDYRIIEDEPAPLRNRFTGEIM